MCCLFIIGRCVQRSSTLYPIDLVGDSRSEGSMLGKEEDEWIGEEEVKKFKDASHSMVDFSLAATRIEESSRMDRFLVGV